MTSVVIRPETSADLSTLHSLIRVAFETAPVRDGFEQDFAHALRNSPAYLPNLAFVASRDNEIIGQIMLTKTVIHGASETWDTLLLGPVCVRLEEREKGVGSALITAALDKAAEQGFESVVLVGDPAFYCRFGFRRADIYKLRNRLGIPPQYTLAKELRPGALAGKSGDVEFGDRFLKKPGKDLNIT